MGEGFFLLGVEMRLYFIRHGQSENNALYFKTGSDRDRVDDPKLTAIGRQQAEVTAAYLAQSSDPTDVEAKGKGFQLTHLYSSLMYRAVSTGTTIAKEVGIPLTSWQDWHENGGIYLQDQVTGTLMIRPGLNSSELADQFPGLLIEPGVGVNGWWNRPCEAEDDRPIRARRVLRDLLARHGGTSDRVGVVSHGGFFMQFLGAVMGIEKIQPVWFRLFNCGITRFDFVGGDQVVVFHNNVAHLGKDLIT
jgi:2,3-bisphosphoglycerate-dependent phosphoglycerate mutase